MKPLTFEDIARILPDFVELTPVRNLLLAHSDPDPEHRWSGSGELETERARRVDGRVLSHQVEALAEQTRVHLLALYGLLGETLKRLAAGDRSGAASALLEAAALEERNARADRARAYAQSAHTLAREANDLKVVATSLRRWGRSDRALGQLPDAVAHYEQGFQVSLAIEDHPGAAEAAIGLGNVLELQGKWELAEDWYQKALEVLDGQPGVHPEQWQAMINLHIVLRSAGALERSITWLARAEEEVARQGDTGAAPYLENARGQLHAWSGDFDLAEQAFRSGLAATDQPFARVTIGLNLAEVLLAQGRSLEAAEEAREAEREALQGALPAKLPEIYRFLGRVAVANGNPDAFVLFERALELQRERGLPDLERALTLQAYAEGELARGESESAEALLREARQLYQSLGIDDLRHPWVDVYDGSKSLDAESDPTQ